MHNTRSNTGNQLVYNKKLKNYLDFPETYYINNYIAFTGIFRCFAQITAFAVTVINV